MKATFYENRFDCFAIECKNEVENDVSFNGKLIRVYLRYCLQFDCKKSFCHKTRFVWKELVLTDIQF